MCQRHGFGRLDAGHGTNQEKQDTEFHTKGNLNQRGDRNRGMPVKAEDGLV